MGKHLSNRYKTRGGLLSGRIISYIPYHVCGWKIGNILVKNWNFGYRNLCQKLKFSSKINKEYLWLSDDICCIAVFCQTDKSDNSNYLSLIMTGNTVRFYGTIRLF